MQKAGLEQFPEQCRQSVQTVADKLKTDYETAYNMLCLESVLCDLPVSDRHVVQNLAEDNGFVLTE